MSSSEELLLEDPVRFIPPNGEEWTPVDQWTPAEWAHWMRQHNAYPFLTHWSEDDIERYVHVDRYKYGLGFQRIGEQQKTWFYLPNPVAVPFHASKIPNLLFGGAAGGSKSHSARWDAYRHCFLVPGFRCIIMRRTMPELKDNHIDWANVEIQRINDFLGKEVMTLYTGDKKEIVVDCHGPGNYSKIVFGHCQNVGDEEKYLGNAYDAFYPDEMATFEQKQIIGVAGRLRSEKRNVVAALRGTSNPGGAHTLWLKEFFIDKIEDQIRQRYPKYCADRYHFIGAMLWDNPWYMDPDGTYTNYEERLFAYDPERRRQLLLGDWTALAGQFFPEFSTTHHVAQLDIPTGCKIERWVDWGYDPHYGMCLWVACLPNGRLYAFMEWKFNGATARQKLVAAQVAEKIKKLTVDEAFPLAKARRITRTLADPSMWGTSGHTGETYAETFSRNGVGLVQADNDRAMGWGRLRHWLRDAPDGHPWLMFHPRCITTIRTLPGLVRDKNDPDDVDTSGEDHPGDACRYGVMGRPTPTALKETLSLVLPFSPAQVMQDMKKAEQQFRRPGMVS